MPKKPMNTIQQAASLPRSKVPRVTAEENRLANKVILGLLFITCGLIIGYNVGFTEPAPIFVGVTGLAWTTYFGKQFLDSRIVARLHELDKQQMMQAEQVKTYNPTNRLKPTNASVQEQDPLKQKIEHLKASTPAPTIQSKPEIQRPRKAMFIQAKARGHSSLKPYHKTQVDNKSPSESSVFNSELPAITVLKVVEEKKINISNADKNNTTKNNRNKKHQKNHPSATHKNTKSLIPTGAKLISAVNTSTVFSALDESKPAHDAVRYNASKSKGKEKIKKNKSIDDNRSETMESADAHAIPELSNSQKQQVVQEEVLVEQNDNNQEMVKQATLEMPKAENVVTEVEHVISESKQEAVILSSDPSVKEEPQALEMQEPKRKDELEKPATEKAEDTALETKQMTQIPEAGDKKSVPTDIGLQLPSGQRRPMRRPATQGILPVLPVPKGGYTLMQHLASHPDQIFSELNKWEQAGITPPIPHNHILLAPPRRLPLVAANVSTQSTSKKNRN